jgi:hypothetical protein
MNQILDGVMIAAGVVIAVVAMHFVIGLVIGAMFTL